MALSDPFSTTYEGARQGMGAYGQALQQTASAFAAKKEEENKRNKSMQMLQQFGILKPTEPTLKDYEDVATKMGVTQFKTLEKAPEEDKLHFAKQMFDALKIPHPQPKGTTVDMEAAQKAGMQYNPMTGDIVFAPKKPEKTLLEQIREAEVAKSSGYEYKGGKVQTEGASRGGMAATITFAEKNAPVIADAFEQGDYGILDRVDARTRSATTRILADRGVSITEPALGYKAKQHAMVNARIQEQKVESAVSAQTLLNSSYDAKTGDYMVPPSQHVELALAGARMLSPTGVVAQEVINELRQKTGREALSQVLIWAGFDPKEVGGSTQSVINMFAKLIEREGSASQDMLENLKKGKTTDFKSMLKEGKSKKYIGTQVAQTAGVAPTVKQIKSDSEYNSLPSGAEFIDPDGKRRRKP